MKIKEMDALTRRAKKNRTQRAALYVRVSTLEQNPGMQVAELKHYCHMRGWLVHKIYRDRGVSGAQASRPELDQLLEDCRKRREPIDVVLVWKFDRFARSVRQLVGALETFRALGIDFVSYTEAIDTTLPHGELVFHILAAIGQWERSLIGERVRSGLAHARLRGKRLGRPPLRQLSRSAIQNLKKERREQRVPYRALAKKWGVSVFTAHKLCNGPRYKTTLY